MISVPFELPRCDQIADRVSELLDGELDQATAARIALHLAICASCAKSAAELAATIQALHRLARVETRTASPRDEHARDVRCARAPTISDPGGEGR